ncbi:MAG: MFS transporter [Thermogemmatispora sp.]|uniref:MFS transporter n=1 Tax=Thermogemmatispora sp. TaxID=1968838 RepID=UPI002605141B|nr:MFS transporter [Thermogemmatispora sp.]MBX5458429.1 MFS transporter [Thermogemmatispora sp.]
MTAPQSTDEGVARTDYPRWFTPGVRAIGLASFLADVGHEIPTALLASLVTITLGAPASLLGFLEGLADGLAGLARFVGGPLADAPSSRRRTAIGGYLSTALLSSLLGAAGAVWQVALLRTAAWFSRGLRVPARNALLADMVPSEVYGRAYGFERMMDNLGAIGGPLLALWLVTLVGVRTAILLSALPGVLAALAIFYAIRHLPRATSRERTRLKITIRPLLRGQLGLVLLGVSFFEASNAAATLLILRATQQLAPGLGLQVATQIGILLYTGYNVAATLASLPAGRLSDSFGPLRILLAGVFLFLLAYLGFAVNVPHIALLAFSFITAGLAIGCIETSEHAAVATLAPADVRGSAFGLLAAIQSFGNLLASGAAGLLWSLISPTAAFLYLAIWAGLASLLLGFLQVRWGTARAIRS